MRTLGTVSGQVTRPGAATIYADGTPITHEEVGMSASEARTLIGDGRAEVIVSHEQADKDFGNGTRSFCSVKLTVNQDEGSISAGMELANELVLAHLPELHAAARRAWETPPAAPAPRGRGRGSAR